MKSLFWISTYPIALIMGLSVIFEPSWMTNDDAAMSMIAHGYGAIAEASAKLIFSNIYWGKLVQLIPTVNGLYGYSIAALGALATAGVVFSLVLHRLQIRPTLIVLAVSAILLQASLFPQFTVTAGLLTVAAVLCLLLYQLNLKMKWLLFACLLGLAGFLIRMEAAALVALISSPLIAWKSLHKDVKFYFFSITLLAVVVFVTIADRNAYSGDEWDQYNNFSPVAAQMNDWGAGKQLLERPDILENYGVSKNDIQVVLAWLWFDQTIANPDRLQPLLDDLRLTKFADGWIGRIGLSLKALDHQDIVFLFAFALLLTVMRPSKKLLLSWLLFFLSISYLGFIGRPAILRVYFPAVSLLIVAAFFNQNRFDKRADMIGMTLLTVCLVLHTYVVVGSSIERYHKSAKIREQLEMLPNDGFVAGYYSTFKANHVFSVTGAANLKNKYNNLYLFGWPAIIPNSLAYKSEKSGEGFQEKLFSISGVWILINSDKVLERYCDNKSRKLVYLIKASKETGGAHKISCQKV